LKKSHEIWEGIPAGSITLNFPGLILRLVMNGIGIGALPDAFVTQAVGQGRDVRILPEWCLPELFCLVPDAYSTPSSSQNLIFY